MINENEKIKVKGKLTVNNDFKYKDVVKGVLKMQDLYMSDDYTYEDELVSNKDDYCLKESDFYPPPDNRVWKSCVRDIRGGDNFADYCEYIFDILDEEEYFES